MRRYSVLLLLLLTLSAVANLVLAWLPMEAGMVKQLASTTAVVDAEAASGGGDTASSKSLVVGRAEASVFSGSVNSRISKEEADVLVNLRKMKADMDLRSKALDIREQAIQEGEKKVASRIEALNALIAKLQDQMLQEKSVKSKKIKKLAAVYSSMKAPKAAKVVAKMEMKTVVLMFSRMDEKKIGKILSFLPPDQAVRISQALTQKVGTL